MLLNLTKSIWLQLRKKSDFYNDLFDAVIDLPDSRQIIDDAPTTETFLERMTYSLTKTLKMTVNKLLTAF